MSRNLFANINDSTRLAGHNRLALLLFRVNPGQLHGINVFKVQEVVQLPPLVAVPGSNAQVMGVARLRQRNIPVLDLSRSILGPPLQNPAYVIVTEFNRTVQGFAVQSVDRIINVDVADVHPPPRVGEPDSYLTAVTRRGDQLVEIVDVERILAEVIGEQKATALRGSAAWNQVLAGRKILVADDSRVARSQIARTLETLGLECILVNDGLEALRMLGSLSERGPIEEQLLMLISDVEMPGMDGYTLTTEIRKDSRFASLYVVLHTSLSGVFNHSLVEQVGADCFIPKFNADELASHVLDQVGRMAEESVIQAA